MCGRCGLAKYKQREERYFDWAGGLRASDRNHEEAQRYFERMQRLSSSRNSLRTLAGEGHEIASRVREGICHILDPSGGANPRNVILGSSTTIALMPALLALSLHEGRKLIGFYPGNSYSPLIQNISPRQVKMEVRRYPTIPPFIQPGDGLYEQYADVMELNKGPIREDEASLVEHRSAAKPDMTVQNYGQDPRKMGILRTLPNSRLMEAWRTACPVGMMMKSGIGMFARDPRPYLREQVRRNDLAIFSYAELVSGQTDRIERESARSTVSTGLSTEGDRRFGLEARILDISHVFGARPILQSDPADIYVGSSSKILAAEPTIGFAYVSDRLLRMVAGNMEKIHERLGDTEFQFHPEVLSDAGRRVRKADARSASVSRHWLSLPELVSFAHALEGFVSEGWERRLEAIDDLYRRLSRSIKRIGGSLEMGGRADLKPFLIKGRAYSPFQTSDEGKEVLDREAHPFSFGGERHKDATLSSLVFIEVRPDDRRAMAGNGFLLNLEGAVLREVHSRMAKRGYMARLMEEDGFRTSPDDFTEYTMGEPDGNRIRISLNHKIEPDIEGLSSAILEALEGYR